MAHVRRIAFPLLLGVLVVLAAVSTAIALSGANPTRLAGISFNALDTALAGIAFNAID